MHTNITRHTCTFQFNFHCVRLYIVWCEFAFQHESGIVSFPCHWVSYSLLSGLGMRLKAIVHTLSLLLQCVCVCVRMCKPLAGHSSDSYRVLNERVLNDECTSRVTVSLVCIPPS